MCLRSGGSERAWKCSCIFLRRPGYLVFFSALRGDEKKRGNVRQSDALKHLIATYFFQRPLLRKSLSPVLRPFPRRFFFVFHLLLLLHASFYFSSTSTTLTKRSRGSRNTRRNDLQMLTIATQRTTFGRGKREGWLDRGGRRLFNCEPHVPTGLSLHLRTAHD